MQTNCIVLKDPNACITHVPVALHMKVETTSVRRGTHFILVIDTSTSMLEESRLENVKHSASLILNFLGPSDRLSLITFGEESEIHCSAVACTSEQKTVIQAVLDKITVDGCTNLSAGLMNVKTVINASSGPASGPALKCGVLLLTDGHANRGVHESDKLLKMFDTVHEQNPQLSFTVVGYGTTHNAVLMKSIAENTNGAYCVVENLEGAATVIGNTIGGLFSCSAQLVKLKCPEGTQVHWAHKVVNGSIIIGDIYDESEQILLFDIPKTAMATPLVLSGTTLPALEAFTVDVPVTPWSNNTNNTELYTAVDLTVLRYTCSSLFKELTTSSNMTETAAKIAEFRTAIFAEKYNSNPVALMLRSECKSLETALANLRVSADANTMTRIHQHVAFTSLGRGMTQEISLTREEDNPNHPVQETSQVMSPGTSRIQRRVTNLMATMSSGGHPNPSDLAAARELSVAPSQHRR
jgi:Ca-activated chloride channel family protein